jgi:hypothetical protein
MGFGGVIPADDRLVAGMTVLLGLQKSLRDKSSDSTVTNHEHGHAIFSITASHPFEAGGVGES